MKKKKLGVRRRSKEAMEVEITSLLDILVILLVFLLSVYSSSDLDLILVGGLTPPLSRSTILGTKAVVVQVDKNKKIWIDGKNIGPQPGEWRRNEIYSLSQALEEEKKQDGALDHGRRINIVLDEGLPYEVMHKVMHTSALVGFTEFKFIVSGH